MTSRRIATVLAVAACLAATIVAAPATGATGVAWAPASAAQVKPGVQTISDGGGQCTSNFVFTDGADVYLGQAAHCTSLGGASETNGCDSGVLAPGTAVTVRGASRPATIVYNSWHTMQAVGETDPDACAYNDFALVRLDPVDRGRVNPSVPVWGGPLAMGDATRTGEAVYTYGNSGLRLGLSALSPHAGVSAGTTAGGWTTSVYTVLPGVPGDSGSAFLDSRGNALGVLSTLEILPLAGSNGVSSLSRAIAYMHAHTALDGVVLAPGTEPFRGAAGYRVRRTS